MMNNNINLDKQPEFYSNMYQSPDINPNCGNKSSNKKVLIIILIIVGIIILIIGALIAGIFAFVNSLLKTEEYKFGEDSIASFYAITETMPNNVSSSSDLDKKTIVNDFQYNRNDNSMYDDLQEYSDYLHDNGFYYLDDVEAGSTNGTIDMAKPTDTDGVIIRITIDYRPGKIELTAMKYEDELTVY